MNYVINKDVKVAAEMSHPMRSGIHDDVVLVEAKHEVLETGLEILALNFEDKKGDRISFSDFPITPDKPEEVMSDEEKKAFDLRVYKKMKVLRQFIIALTGKEDVVIDTPSFKELAESLVKLFSSDVKPVRIKATYNNKGYIGIPKTHWTTVIETMDIPREETTIEILDGDIMERPQKDEEKKEVNPLGMDDIKSTPNQVANVEAIVTDPVSSEPPF